MFTPLKRLLMLIVSATFALSTLSTSPPVSAASGSTVAASGSLEQMLAPIALYPDSLLAQILMASTYPLEIVEAARWRKANPSLKDQALDDALQQKGWDPSVKSLTAFTPVLEMMNEKLEWTQKLGDAFLSDQKAILDTVQKLRKTAHEAGNLKSGKEQTVSQTTENGQTVIKIEPTKTEVVYVPSYNPTVVYGTWPYPSYPPYPYYPPGYAPGAAFWTFTAGVVAGAALWGNCNWGSGDVNINNSSNTTINRGSGNTGTGAGSGANRPSGGTGPGAGAGGKWQHNPEHRKGVSYKDPGVSDRYGRGSNSRDVQSREQFRGRSEQGRSDMGQRPDSGNRASGGRDGGGRDFSGGRQSSSFGGRDQGGRSNDFSSRGQNSRQSMSGGSRGGGGGGASRGGGGGGGGGRGGGGRR